MGKFYDELGRELSLYVRQLAWLGTAPKQRQSAGKTTEDPDPQTRLQRMTADGIVPELPPIRTPWIIDTLMDIGASEPGAMGAVPLSWGTIAHWQSCMGLELAPWFCRLLRRLSVEFVAESQNAREPDCPAPWTAVTDDHNRATISRKVSQAFRSLTRSKEDAP